MGAPAPVERGRASGRDAVDLQELARPAPPHDVEAEAAGSLREARVHRVTPQITRLLCEHRHWRGAERERERERTEPVVYTAPKEG